MRNIETIDAELRLIAVLRTACATDGMPLRSTRHMDELLDERLQITKLGGP